MMFMCMCLCVADLGERLQSFAGEETVSDFFKVLMRENDRLIVGARYDNMQTLGFYDVFIFQWVPHLVVKPHVVVGIMLP